MGASVSPVASNSQATNQTSSATATSNAQVVLPALGALSGGTVTLPVVTSGSQSRLRIQTLVGASATQSAARRGAQSIANSTAFAEVIITAQDPVTFTGTFTATITYVGGPLTYFGTFEDPNGNLTSTPQQTASGTTYTLTSPSGTYTMAAGQSVAFDFASAPGAASALVFTPPSLSFTNIGAPAAQTVTVSEANYSGAFTATSENAAVATATISGATITVTPVAAGTTSIDIAGGTATGKISITVTTSPVTIQ